MNEFEQAKQIYDQTPIPEELNARVLAGIAQGRENKRRASRQRATCRFVGTFAACFAMLFVGLNVSPTFAKAAGDVPVLGGLLQVLTVRSFTDTDGDRTVEVEEPGISGDTAFVEKMNAEIQARVNEQYAQGEQLVAEYREAFFATGGTEEEWAQHENRITVTYEIKSQTDTTVSFVVDSAVSIANAYQEKTFYNLDLSADRELTLLDVLGSDWVEICNAAINSQMAAAEDPTVFFGKELGGFSTVDDQTGFYLNEAGNPVVVFPRATVAIGAMGAVEFEITA